MGVASVVPRLTAQWVTMCEKHLGVTPFVLGPGVRTGMRILLKNPAEVGADRIVNAVAGLETLRRAGASSPTSARRPTSTWSPPTATTSAAPSRPASRSRWRRSRRAPPGSSRSSVSEPEHAIGKRHDRGHAVGRRLRLRRPGRGHRRTPSAPSSACGARWSPPAASPTLIAPPHRRDRDGRPVRSRCAASSSSCAASSGADAGGARRATRRLGGPHGRPARQAPAAAHDRRPRRSTGACSWRPWPASPTPAFRRCVRRFGAGLVFTEMISAHGVVHDNRRTLDYLACDAGRAPDRLSALRRRRRPCSPTRPRRCSCAAGADLDRPQHGLPGAQGDEDRRRRGPAGRRRSGRPPACGPSSTRWPARRAGDREDPRGAARRRRGGAPARRPASSPPAPRRSASIRARRRSSTAGAPTTPSRSPWPRELPVPVIASGDVGRARRPATGCSAPARRRRRRRHAGPRRPRAALGVRRGARRAEPAPPRDERRRALAPLRRRACCRAGRRAPWAPAPVLAAVPPQRRPRRRPLAPRGSWQAPRRWPRRALSLGDSEHERPRRERSVCASRERGMAYTARRSARGLAVGAALSSLKRRKPVAGTRDHPHPRGLPAPQGRDRVPLDQASATRSPSASMRPATSATSPRTPSTTTPRTSRPCSSSASSPSKSSCARRHRHRLERHQDRHRRGRHQGHAAGHASAATSCSTPSSARPRPTRPRTSCPTSRRSATPSWATSRATRSSGGRAPGLRDSSRSIDIEQA